MLKLLISDDMNMFEIICKNIQNKVPVDFSWDEHFPTVVAVLNKEEMAKIIPDLVEIFDHKWDDISIDATSDSILRYFTEIFGMIPGQTLYATIDKDGWLLYACFWPWGNENKASLRIGIMAPEEQPFDRDLIRENLSEWFEIKEISGTSAAPWSDF